MEYLNADRTPATDQSVIIEMKQEKEKTMLRLPSLSDGVGFYTPQPHPSWTLNTTSYIWRSSHRKALTQMFIGMRVPIKTDNTKGWTTIVR